MPPEAMLEEMVKSRPEILSADWMLIGQQERTDFGGRIDLLAIAPDASLVLIELKRDRTPREVVAQALDYAAWVERLTRDRVMQIYRRFADGRDLADDFRARFGAELVDEEINNGHQIILVAAELDDASERIVQYLNNKDVAVNVIFFQVFQAGEQLLLSRAWLIDPGETQVNAATSSPRGSEGKEAWNGEYYVSYGSGRSWDDASTYGFISAGGGSWYSKTLAMLKPGDRIWVNIPRVGYVGVGRVREAMQPLREVCFDLNGESKPAFEVLRDGPKYLSRDADPEQRDYAVLIDWLDTVPTSQAFNEIGLFGNQNTVCQPRTPRWRHTVERLKTVFGKWDRG